MAKDFDIKTKSFFQIPPKKVRDKINLCAHSERVVFMDVGFDLDDIRKISEVYEVRTLHYVFFVHLGYSDDMKLEFEFKRKQDAMSAQAELTRAWTRTGEFTYADENLDAGKSSDTE
nr:hypothetical protein 9 [Gammaproteobacteria bacterium]